MQLKNHMVTPLDTDTYKGLYATIGQILMYSHDILLTALNTSDNNTG